MLDEAGDEEAPDEAGEAPDEAGLALLAAAELALAVRALAWALRAELLLAVLLEVPAGQLPLDWVGAAPAGAYGGWPPGSGGHAPGFEGSGELTPI